MHHGWSPNTCGLQQQTVAVLSGFALCLLLPLPSHTLAYTYIHTPTYAYTHAQFCVQQHTHTHLDGRACCCLCLLYSRLHAMLHTAPYDEGVVLTPPTGGACQGAVVYTYIHEQSVGQLAVVVGTHTVLLLRWRWQLLCPLPLSCAVLPRCCLRWPNKILRGQPRSILTTVLQLSPCRAR